MTTDYDRIAHDWWDKQPHPKAPTLTFGEFPTAVKLATKSKFGDHATAKEAELFWHEFKSTGLQPHEYEEMLDRMAPLSFALHGRPPSMSEIVRHKDSDPKAVRDYYHNLPSQMHPEITAGEMLKALRTAEPYAQQHLGRVPVMLEAAHIHHAGGGAAYAERYYMGRAEADAKGQGIEAQPPAEQNPSSSAPGRDGTSSQHATSRTAHLDSMLEGLNALQT